MDKPQPFLPPGLTIFLILVLCCWFGRPFTEFAGEWSFWQTAKMMGFVFAADLVINMVWGAVRRDEPRHTAPETWRLGWGPILFSLLVWAPLTEELVFRYVLVGALHDVSPVLALGASGVLFGFVHTRGWVPKSLMGILFAWLYVHSGTLWVPMLMHFAWNGLVVLVHYDDLDRAIRRARGY